MSDQKPKDDNQTAASETVQKDIDKARDLMKEAAKILAKIAIHSAQDSRGLTPSDPPNALEVARYAMNYGDIFSEWVMHMAIKELKKHWPEFVEKETKKATEFVKSLVGKAVIGGIGGTVSGVPSNPFSFKIPEDPSNKNKN